MPPVIALENVQHVEIRKRVRNGKKFDEIICSVGLAGFRRIADNAIDALYSSRIKRTFCRAYDDFRAEWRQKKKAKRQAGIKEDRDVLAAFAQDVLDVDRSTAGRYVDGTTKKTDPSTLDKHLMKVGASLASVIPSALEKKIAVISATATAMLRARKIHGIRVELTEDELLAIEWLRHAHPPDELALRSEKAWKQYIEYFSLIGYKNRWQRQPEWLPCVLTGDWTAALGNKWLPWQFVVAIIVLHRLPRSRAEAAEPAMPFSFEQMRDFVQKAEADLQTRDYSRMSDSEISSHIDELRNNFKPQSRSHWLRRSGVEIQVNPEGAELLRRGFGDDAVIEEELSAFAMEGPEAEELQNLIQETLRRDLAAAEKNVRRQTPPEKKT